MTEQEQLIDATKSDAFQAIDAFFGRIIALARNRQQSLKDQFDVVDRRERDSLNVVKDKYIKDSKAYEEVTAKFKEFHDNYDDTEDFN
jgi:hypothetical protein